MGPPSGIETAMTLRDARDQALDELSSLVDISYNETADGIVKVSIEGTEFIDESRCYHIEKKTDKLTGFITPYWGYLSDVNKGKYVNVFDFGSRDISTENKNDMGELKALVLARGDHIANYTDIVGLDQDTYNDSTGMSVMLRAEAQLDQMIHGIVTALNDVLCPNVTAEDTIKNLTNGAATTLDVTLADGTEQILWTIRMPRILLALLVGAGLSVSGCAFQSLFANPLTTPDTLGVASGASFGAALALLMGWHLRGVQALALVCGIGAVALTWLSVAGRDRTNSTVILAGIMVGSWFSALVSLVKLAADTESQLPAITYWLMGSFNSAGYSSLALGAPPILLGMLVLYLLRWRLNILPLSEDEARASGTDVRLLRGITVLCATAITASCVSMCGQVGWVGLLVPHMCRMKFGNNHLALVPASACVGAAFMVAVDTLARSISSAQIPVSALTAVIGAPFFIALVRKTGGWRL